MLGRGKSRVVGAVRTGFERDIWTGRFEPGRAGATVDFDCGVEVA